MSNYELALHTSIGSPSDVNRGNLTWEKAVRVITLPFTPRETKTLKKYNSVTEIDPEEIRHYVEAIAFDINGVLTPHEKREITPEIISFLEETRKRLKAVCFYSNSPLHKDFFAGLPIPVAKHVPAKPDPTGFEVVRKLYLKNTPAHLCAMVGDNYATDGGCRSAGWKYIHISPLQGNESSAHKLTRAYASSVAKFHDALFQR